MLTLHVSVRQVLTSFIVTARFFEVEGPEERPTLMGTSEWCVNFPDAGDWDQLSSATEAVRQWSERLIGTQPNGQAWKLSAID